MTTLSIQDLAADKDLCHDAMIKVSGGWWNDYSRFNQLSKISDYRKIDGYSKIDLLSPSYFNMDTPIIGGSSVLTLNNNSLSQVDIATTGVDLTSAMKS